MPPETQPAIDGNYLPISPVLLFPQTRGSFAVFIKLGGSYVLYAHPEEPFTAEQRQRLYERGVEELYILVREKAGFEDYLEEHLGDILQNDDLPLDERSKVFTRVSTGIIQETITGGLPPATGRQKMERILNVVNQGILFLAKGGSLKSLASFISHDYRTYSHCVQVFVYATSILQEFNLDDEAMIQWGLGAILHDIGKTLIPKSILNKPGPLSPAERRVVETHPVKGVALCCHGELTQATVNAILFHHEKVDGSGYPSGMNGEEMPLPVKALAVADVYDALVSNRIYARARSPFEALSLMKHRMMGHFDEEVFRKFVMILAGADVVEIKGELKD